MIPATSLEHHFGRPEAKILVSSILSRQLHAWAPEYGGDLIKTIYSGTSKNLPSVVSQYHVCLSWSQAGQKSGSDAEFLSMVRACMDAGAAGVTMGRNHLGRPKFEALLLLCARSSMMMPASLKPYIYCRYRIISYRRKREERMKKPVVGLMVNCG